MSNILPTKMFEQERKYPTYTPTNDEKTKIWYIDRRFNEMYQGRSLIDKDWKTYQDMIDAIFIEYPDERSSSVVPLASALIELYVAEANKLPTEYNFRSETTEHSTGAKALEYVWDYDYRRNKRKAEFTYNEYICAWFWTSVMYTWFESYNKEQYDPIIWDDLQLGFQKKTIEKRKILVNNTDIRQYYLDNQAINKIEDASDCLYRQWISYEKFENFKWDPLYKNLKYVKPKQYDNDYKSFVIIEEASRQWDFVELLHYWNVEKDAYMVIANWILIREHPMTSTIAWEKALPFVIRPFGKRNYNIYGRGICEVLMMFNSEVNNLRELLLDSIRRSNTQVLALWNGLNFDWRSFSYDNEILTFDWVLANNFEQISGNPPNQAIFNYLDRLYKDIAVFTWIDIQNILWEPQQTAFQTEVQREASQKRINVRLTNRDLANERFADLYKDLLQKYFPLKTAEWLYPQIEIEDEALVNWKFKKKKGKNVFEVTPELLRWDIYIDVYTNTTATTINAVDRDQKLSLLNTVWQIAQWYAVAEQAGISMDSILPIKDTLRDLAADYNLETKAKDDNEEVQEEKMKLMNELQAMKPQPQQAGWEEVAPIEESPLQPKEQWWQNSF